MQEHNFAPALKIKIPLSLFFPEKSSMAWTGIHGFSYQASL
jgi:hypothetical protein